MNKPQLGVMALGIAVVVAGAGIMVAQLLPAEETQVVTEPNPSARSRSCRANTRLICA